MSFEEAEVLRRRAESFLINTVNLLSEDEANLAVFGLGQYYQLILKYKILVKKGSNDRICSLRRLIHEAGDLNSRISVFLNDIENLHYIYRLEEVYIPARHLPIDYEVP
ncbi:MAG: HEPN domain-containing protein [Ignisphaera sp.]